MRSPQGREAFRRYYESALALNSDECRRLGAAARKAAAYLVIGVIEKDGGTLYCTVLFFGPDGALLGKHRKTMPTAMERLIWGFGDGSTLTVLDTSVGRLGAVICWENYMPLARYTMYAWGTQIYVAATWDCGQPWLSTLRHIAKEGRVYVIGCCIAMRKDDIPDSYSMKQKYYAEMDEWINIGDSAIVNPEGHFIAGPVRKQEEILYAEIDPRMVQGPKWMLDVAGHYARPDVFELTVHTDVRRLMRVEEGS